MERINAPFTGEHFIETLRKWRELGSPYWYGTHGHKCTEDLLKRKSAQYPVPKYSHYKSSRMPEYRADIAENAICADCIGALKAYAWTNGGEGLLESYGKPGAIKQDYQSHGVPDRSANGMFEYAKEQGMEWGSIDTMPEIIGLCVRYDGHVGFYAGNGEVEEWRGFAYGSQRTRLKDRKWTHWYKHPALNYSDGSATEPIVYTLGSRLLLLRKPETSGSDVEMLVSLLMQLGYNIPEDKRDGTYNSAVSAAVIRFQAASQLLGDGDYGPDTHKALMAAVSDADAGQAPAEPDEPSAPETPEEPAQPEEPVQPEEPAVRMVKIISKGGAVNIRSGNGTQYAKVTTVKPGMRFVYVATAVNGWNALEINGQIGWVSGEYSKAD